MGRKLTPLGDLLDSYPRVPLGYFKRLFSNDRVTLHGRPLVESETLPLGTEYTIDDDEENLKSFDYYEAINIDNIDSFIVYEDEGAVILNKPKGILSIGLDGGESISSILRERATKRGDGLPSPANRLDRNTSGLIVFGKTPESRSSLATCFEKGNVQKTYLALAKGHFEDKEGLVDAPLRKDVVSGRVVVDPKGKKSSTVYKVIEDIGQSSLLEVTLLTGRMHQIRVHLSHVGHPIAGDPDYGDPAYNESFYELGLFDQFLHCKSLMFKRLKQPMKSLESRRFEAPLPKLLEEVLASLRN